MNVQQKPEPKSLGHALRCEGYAFVPSVQMQSLLEMDFTSADWVAFSESWSDLHIDTYMADQGKYRRRRHAVFNADQRGEISLQAHQPHYQSSHYNTMHGDLLRWFSPIVDSAANGASLNTILNFTHALFSSLSPDIMQWHIEVHQFRIEAQQGMQGKPTPEGIHRDGVDWVLVLMINRENIASGTTTVHAPSGETLGEFTLTKPFDAALVDDHRVAHGVTPVDAVDASKPAYRDVLVVTFVRATHKPTPATV